MRRARNIPCFRIILASHIFVADKNAQRCARRPAFKDAADDFRNIRFLPLSRYFAFGFAFLHLLAHPGFVDADARRQTLNHDADRFTVALAEQRQLDTLSNRTFHRLISLFFSGFFVVFPCSALNAEQLVFLIFFSLKEVFDYKYSLIFSVGISFKYASPIFRSSTIVNVPPSIFLSLVIKS